MKRLIPGIRVCIQFRFGQQLIGDRLLLKGFQLTEASEKNWHRDNHRAIKESFQTCLINAHLYQHFFRFLIVLTTHRAPLQVSIIAVIQPGHGRHFGIIVGLRNLRDVVDKTVRLS